MNVNEGHQHATESLSNRRLWIAVGCNLLLTVVEVVGGLLSGSLSLLADALHNFGDCGSLLIALVARRVAQQPADFRRTFGYRRAEVVGALINLTVLIVVGLYLVYEAALRLMDPQEIEGWTMLIVAGVALIVDVATVALLNAGSQHSLNLRAAMLHNLSDALGSVGVIVVGVAILLWNLQVLDVVVTVLIAGYILWQSLAMIRQSIRILMESVPEDIQLDDLVREMELVDGVVGVHHVHVWQLDEQHRAIEAHVVIASSEDWIPLKRELKSRLAEVFAIAHATLEFELEEEYQEGIHDTSIVPFPGGPCG